MHVNARNQAVLTVKSKRVYLKCPGLVAFKYFPVSSPFYHPDIQTSAVFANHCIMFKQTEFIFYTKTFLFNLHNFK